MKSKASLDLGITGDVDIIIKIDEFMVSQIAIGCQRGHDQEQAGYYFPMAVLHVASYLTLASEIRQFPLSKPGPHFFNDLFRAVDFAFIKPSLKTFAWTGAGTSGTQCSC